jgi:hypothetical protein
MKFLLLKTHEVCETDPAQLYIIKLRELQAQKGRAQRKDDHELETLRRNNFVNWYEKLKTPRT